MLLEQEKGNHEQSEIGLTEPIEAEVHKGVLKLKGELEICSEPKDTSILHLAYRVEPTADDTGLMGSQGFTVLSARYGKLSDRPTEVPWGQDLHLIRKDGAEFRGNFGFRAKDWDIKYGGISDDSDYDAEHWRQEVAADVSVCLLARYERTEITDQPFLVALSTNPDPKQAVKTLITTDLRGCLEWRENLFREDGEEGSYPKRWIHIVGNGGYYPGATLSIPVWINTAEPKHFFRKIGPGAKDVVAPAPAKTHLSEMTSFSIKSETPEFFVDDHLDFTKRFRYHLRLSPRLLRETAKETEDRNPPLEPGSKVRIRGWLVSDFSGGLNQLTAEIAQKHFLSAFSTEAEVRDNKERTLEIFTELPINFGDLDKFQSRVFLILELQPLGRGKLPGPVTIAADVILLTRGSLPVMSIQSTAQVPFSLEELHKSNRFHELSFGGVTSRHPATPYEASSAKYLQQYWSKLAPTSLIDMEASDPQEPFSRWPEGRLSEQAHSDVLALLKSRGLKPEGEKVVSHFCQTLGNAIEKESCRRKPTSYFRLSRFSLVESVDPDSVQPLIVGGFHRPFIIVNATYFRETSASEKELVGDKNLTIDMTSWQGINGYNHFGNGAARVQAYTKQDERYAVIESYYSEETKARLSSSENVSLTYEKHHLAFTGAARECVLLAPSPLAQTLAQAEVFILCGELKENEPLKESYYMVFEESRPNQGGLSDSLDARERGWSKLIRTPEGFEAYSEMLKDATRNYRFVRKGIPAQIINSFVDAETEEGRARLESTGGVFVGLQHFIELEPLQWSFRQVKEKAELCAAETLKQAKKPHTKQAIAITNQYCVCLTMEAAHRWRRDAFDKRTLELSKLLVGDDVLPQVCGRFAVASEGKL